MTDPVTIKDVEKAIPDDRKNLSFGDDGEDVLDVMDRMDKEAHHNGRHMNDEHECCPFCPDPENEHVAVRVTGNTNDTN